MTLVLDSLTARDLPGALRLSTQAGWNQLPADWNRLLETSPGGCIAGRVDGRLVATATLASYGRDAHWIGMVLVDPECRGKGFGSTILTEALNRGNELGGEAVGLDATDLGRPVYLKQGFVDVAPINRWGGMLLETGQAPEVELLDRSAFDEVVALDREQTRVDRSALFLSLMHEENVFGWVARDGDAIRGFAFVRPGHERHQLGPVVALTPEIFGRLLARTAHHLRGGAVLIDAFQNDMTSRVLEAQGLALQRRLTRMTYGRRQELLMGPGVRAATAFEWG